MSTPDSLKKLIIGECARRRQLYNDIIAWPNDPPEKQEEHRRRCLMMLKLWESDTVQFVKDNAWANDPRDLFGASSIPQGYAPKGMVPIILYPIQREMIEKLDDAINSGEQVDVIIDACRQVIKTTGVIWCLLKYWLFRPGTIGVWTTYQKDLIDSGGKGQRDLASMFGRFRLFLDAFMWNVSVPYTKGWLSQVRFNQHLKPPWRKGRKKSDIPTEWMESAGLTDSEDVSNKIVRGKLIVHGVPVVPEAEGNLIAGMVPGKDTGRSFTGTYLYADEFQRYNDNFGAGTDRAVWGATGVNIRCRIVTCTVPDGGGSGTKAKELCTEVEASEGHVRHSIDWCDVPPYLEGAKWECPTCQYRNPWTDNSRGPGEGMEKACAACTRPTIVTRFNLWSPWRKRAEAKIRDKAQIHGEILRDWAGAVSDRLFSGWHGSSGVRPYDEPRKMLMFDGIDPGQSSANPGSLVCVAFDTDTQTPWIVGYWMAMGVHAEYWVPFLRRWSPDQLKRMRVIHSVRHEGMTFADAFDYDEDALKMLDWISKTIRPTTGLRRFPPGQVWGDKYGGHEHMTDSAYTLLETWKVEVNREYTQNRQDLVRKGVEWASRAVIASEIANLRPPSPLGRAAYPSIRMVFEGAKPKPHAGQSDYKFDVDKQDPPHMSHAVDAWCYLCKPLDGSVHGVVGEGGEWGPEGYSSEPDVFVYGGDRSLQ